MVGGASDEEPLVFVNTEKEHDNFSVFGMDLIAWFVVCEAGAIARRLLSHGVSIFSTPGRV
jgi:hypothetical protein